MTRDEGFITFQLDPRNPGQFFACCGLLELAHRMWPGAASGRFQEHGRRFEIRVAEPEPGDLRSRLVTALLDCAIDNVMTAEQKHRLEILTSMTKKQVEASEFEEEKKDLESLRREAPVTFGAPFDLTIDWHQDDRAGGSNFKTWAGQQSIIDIARGMQGALRAAVTTHGIDERALSIPSRGSGLPFNFDADLGGQGAAIDVGFSFDPLPNISVGSRPALELCAFVGLQRFRPVQVQRQNRYHYATWEELLPPSIAGAAASVQLDNVDHQTFEFRLLYRTKYLKSFLASKPVRGES